MTKVIPRIAIWHPAAMGIIYASILVISMKEEYWHSTSVGFCLMVTFYSLFLQIPIVIFWIIKKKWANILLTLVSIALFFIIVVIGVMITATMRTIF
jgi:hypothetical protein